MPFLPLFGGAGGGISAGARIRVRRVAEHTDGVPVATYAGTCGDLAPGLRVTVRRAAEHTDGVPVSTYAPSKCAPNTESFRADQRLTVRRVAQHTDGVPIATGRCENCNGEGEDPVGGCSCLISCALTATFTPVGGSGIDVDLICVGSLEVYGEWFCCNDEACEDTTGGTFTSTITPASGSELIDFPSGTFTLWDYETSFWASDSFSYGAGLFRIVMLFTRWTQTVAPFSEHCDITVCIHQYIDGFGWTVACCTSGGRAGFGINPWGHHWDATAPELDPELCEVSIAFGDAYSASGCGCNGGAIIDSYECDEDVETFFLDIFCQDPFTTPVQNLWTLQIYPTP